MKFKKSLFSYVSTRSSIFTDIIWALFEEIEERITFLNVILAIVIPWLLIVFAPLLCKIIMWAMRILDCSPVLIDQKDFNLLMATMFIALFLLFITHLKEYCHILVRCSFYFVLFFLLFSKLTSN